MCLIRFSLIYLPAAVIRTAKTKFDAEVQAMEQEQFEVPGLNVKIRHKAHCSMIDGKVRKVWTDVTNCSTNCPICGATPSQMGKPKHELHDFVPLPGVLQYTCGGVHGYLRSFDWFNKNRFHWDFKLWACT